MLRLVPVLVIAVSPWLPLPGQSLEKTVTLVVAFDGGQPQGEVVDALKSELAEIWHSTHVKLDWRPAETVRKGDSFEDLVMVHFVGDCRVHPPSAVPPGALFDERGPQAFDHATLAYSSVVDGEVQPFSNVLCDRVERSVKSALAPGERKRASSLYGKALGRVLSHELYHVLNQTKGHEKNGIAKQSLTGRQLITPGFRLE